jgi:hypothetical protein
MPTENESDPTRIIGKESYPKLMVSYNPGRWGKIFHLFDTDGREIALHQKDALKMARQILKESKR